MAVVRLSGYPNTDIPKTSALLLALLRPYLPQNVLYVSILGDLVLLLQGDDYPEQTDRALLRQSLVNALQDVADCRVVMSDPVGEVNALRDTYSNLLNILQMSPGTIPSSIVVNADNRVSPLHSRLLSIGHETIYRYIQNGQDAALSFLIDECAALIEKDGPDSEYIVHYIFQISACAMTTLTRDFPELAEKLTIVRFSKHADITQLLVQLRRSLLSACDQIRTLSTSADQAGTQQIMRYIDENIGNPDLYIKMVTTEFNISENTLQTLIHEQSGLSFFAYIDRLRMLRAQTLLLETEKLINEISALCGYTSPGTFSRSFRRFHGVTPSDMRAQAKRPSGSATPE